MLNYKKTKKDYFYLKTLYGGNTFSYTRCPRKVNYNISIPITSGTNRGNWILKFGTPILPKTQCNYNIHFTEQKCDYQR